MRVARVEAYCADAIGYAAAMAEQAQLFLALQARSRPNNGGPVPLSEQVLLGGYLGRDGAPVIRLQLHYDNVVVTLAADGSTVRFFESSRGLDVCGGLSTTGGTPRGRESPAKTQGYTYPEEVEMKLSAPKMITWVVALVVGVIGILIHVGSLSIVAVPFGLGFWLVAVAFVLLLVATLLKGL